LNEAPQVFLAGLCQLGCLGVGFKENGVKQLLLVGEELHILDIEGKYLGREFEEGGIYGKMKG
jgi:hypothetical protein